MKQVLATDSFEDLKKGMWENSNKIIDTIIAFAEKTWLELSEITDSIKGDMVHFLSRKKAITGEYPEWHPTWDEYRYDNRLQYRMNTRTIIERVLQQADKKMGNRSDERIINLKKELENEFRNPKP